jgi:hypothetical protein
MREPRRERNPSVLFAEVYRGFSRSVYRKSTELMQAAL